MRRVRRNRQVDVVNLAKLRFTFDPSEGVNLMLNVKKRGQYCHNTLSRRPSCQRLVFHLKSQKNAQKSALFSLD